MQPYILTVFCGDWLPCSSFPTAPPHVSTGYNPTVPGRPSCVPPLPSQPQFSLTPALPWAQSLSTFPLSQCPGRWPETRKEARWCFHYWDHYWDGSHIPQVHPLKLQKSLVFIHRVVHPSPPFSDFRPFWSLRTETPVSVSSHSLFAIIPILPGPWKPLIQSVSIYLPVLDISPKQNHITGGPGWSTPPSQHDVSRAHWAVVCIVTSFWFIDPLYAPLRVYPTFCLSAHQLRDTWRVSALWVWGVMLLWASLWKLFCGPVFLFLWGYGMAFFKCVSALSLKAEPISWGSWSQVGHLTSCLHFLKWQIWIMTPAPDAPEDYRGVG